MTDPPEISKIVFGDVTIHAHCWCDACGWEMYPTGWYDSDGSIVTLERIVEIWQGAHDGVCEEKIRWEDTDATEVDRLDEIAAWEQMEWGDDD